MTVTTAQSDGNDSRHVVLRTTTLEKTQGQVGALLSILDKCSDILVSNPEVGSTIEIDKEAQLEASKTYCLAQVQLRNMIDDMSRWTTVPEGSESDATRLIAEAIATNKKQQKVADTNLRPSTRFRPRVRYFPTVGWIAWLGLEDAPRKPDVHGVGESAELAMEAFDRAFVAKNSEKAQAAVAAAKAPVPAKKPRKKKA